MGDLGDLGGLVSPPVGPSGKQILGIEPQSTTQVLPSALPPLEAGTPTAEAIYRVFAGQRQVALTMERQDEQIAAGAFVASIVALRSPWRVRLVAVRAEVRHSLIEAVRELGQEVRSDLTLTPFGPAGSRHISVGPVEARDREVANVVVDWHGSETVERIALAGVRAVFVVLGNVPGLCPLHQDLAADIPLDIVLAGAPDEMWADRKRSQ